MQFRKHLAKIYNLNYKKNLLNVCQILANFLLIILEKMILDGKEKGLSEDFILKIFKAIHQESINHQEKILKD